jgi:hypothetical protein
MFVKILLLVCVMQPDKLWLKCLFVLKWEEMHLRGCRWWKILALVDIGADRTFGSDVYLCTAKIGNQKMVRWISECKTGRNVRITGSVLYMVSGIW